MPSAYLGTYLELPDSTLRTFQIQNLYQLFTHYKP